MDVYLGMVQLFAFSYAPQGWLPCNGQTLSITQNQALYAILGTTYGGDGKTTFCLPNLNGYGGTVSAAPSINGFDQYYIAVQGLFPVRQ